ncbi:MAG: carbohydrate ABC transporter permease [Clostridia bacterium]|nr:carbohydrate ABC transporter permease [Clostridia bacterium]
MTKENKVKRHLLKRAKVNRSHAGNFVVFAFIFVLGVFMAIPLVYAISNSFKPLDELWIFPPPLFPNQPTLENYTGLFGLLGSSWVPMSRYLFNTIFITVVGTVGQVVLGSMCAYPLAKHDFPGNKFIFKLIFFSLMFSGAVTSIPSYLIMVELGWVDTYQALIVPAMGSTMGLYLMKQFMEQIPNALLEAARIDGAGEWRIFWRIVMPMVKPAWLTLIVFSVQGLWNMGASTLIYSEQLKTFPYAITQIISGGIARAGVSTAVTVLMMIVPLTVFIITQSNIIETMSTSGVKE